MEHSGYRVHETILNRKSGSAFDLWNSMGGVELESEADIAYLAKRSIPDRNLYSVTVKKGVLEIDAMLDMLEVRLILLTPEE